MLHFVKCLNLFVVCTSESSGHRSLPIHQCSCQVQIGNVQEGEGATIDWNFFFFLKEHTPTCYMLVEFFDNTFRLLTAYISACVVCVLCFRFAIKCYVNGKHTSSSFTLKKCNSVCVCVYVCVQLYQVCT